LSTLEPARCPALYRGASMIYQPGHRWRALSREISVRLTLYRYTCDLAHKGLAGSIYPMAAFRRTTIAGLR
jgi:hypothetical protein